MVLLGRVIGRNDLSLSLLHECCMYVLIYITSTVLDVWTWSEKMKYVFKCCLYRFTQSFVTDPISSVSLCRGMFYLVSLYLLSCLLLSFTL